MDSKYLTISEAAKLSHMTSETLRHYDRIGLVKPSMKDERTNYRYYSQQDIVRLNTVHALQQMDLPLKEIKRVLCYDDLEKIIEFLEKAEKKADEKIAALSYSRSKIRLAKADYEKKLRSQTSNHGIFTEYFNERVIMLSNTLKTPTLDNLWNYLSHFYDKINPDLRSSYIFEDLAGIYTENGHSCLFALCTSYPNTDGLKILPPGKYLCAVCTETTKNSIMDALLVTAREDYGLVPEFTLQLIIVSGILNWKYELQIPIEIKPQSSQDIRPRV